MGIIEWVNTHSLFRRFGASRLMEISLRLHAKGLIRTCGVTFSHSRWFIHEMKC